MTKGISIGNYTVDIDGSEVFIFDRNNDLKDNEEKVEAIVKYLIEEGFITTKEVHITIKHLARFKD